MDILPRASGIYQITCASTGKIYIGSAINLRRRWQLHLIGLRSGRHVNRHLQNAWIKYGEASFQFEVVEFTEPSTLLNREQYWLDKTKAYARCNGFNLYKIAGSPLGSKHSDATREKMSRARRGRSFGPLSVAHRAAVSAGLKEGS